MKTQRTEPMLTEHSKAQKYQSNSLQSTWNNRMGFIYNKYHYTEISESHDQDSKTYSTLTSTKMNDNNAAVDIWANKNNPNGWSISKQEYLKILNQKV